MAVTVEDVEGPVMLLRAHPEHPGAYLALTADEHGLYLSTALEPEEAPFEAHAPFHPPVAEPKNVNQVRRNNGVSTDGTGAAGTQIARKRGMEFEDGARDVYRFGSIWQRSGVGAGCG
jgi:hypothetical protein